MSGRVIPYGYYPGHGRSGWEESTSSQALTEFGDCLSFMLQSNGAARYKYSLGLALWLNQGCFTPISTILYSTPPMAPMSY